MRRTYSEVILLPTLRERYDYLALRGEVGCPTFGSSRWMNQGLYTSREWRDIRRHILLRDQTCDLAVPDYVIHSRAVVHHLNPITEKQIEERSRALFDPENLITTTHDTHNAIHYGDERLLPQPFLVRRPGDTKEW